MQTKKQMVTIPEASRLIDGITEHYVRTLCLNKKIPYVMAGRRYLIFKDGFLAYFDEQEAAFKERSADVVH